MAEPLNKVQNSPCQSKQSLNELRVEKEVFEDGLVKNVGRGRQAVHENQRQIAGAKTACPEVYKNAHQQARVNIQNDRMLTL